MKSFYEIQSSEEKNFHDFNVSQSLPRFLWTLSFVVLCLIFFLCKAGMDSRFQLRLLFHCFQGLFLRSHMGYCDECTLWGVCSPNTQKPESCWEVVPMPQYYIPPLPDRVASECPTHSLLATDKSLHPKSLMKPEVTGVGQALRKDLFILQLC